MPLSEHRIKEVKCGAIRNMWPRLIGRNGKSPIHGYGYSTKICILTTDTGYTGWGIGVPDTTMKLLFEGTKLSDLFVPETGIVHKAFAGADMALHDLAGKILGIPVANMINPDTDMKAFVYDGAIYQSDLTEHGDMGVEAVMKDARDDAKRGYVDYKVKIGRGAKWMPREEGMKRDSDVIHALRKEYPNALIMVDANDMMDLPTAIEMMEMIKDCDIFWFEEPFVENYEDCMRFKEYLAKESPNTLLADGEFEYDTDHIIDLAKRGALDVLLPDPVGFGFTQFRKVMSDCRGTKIMCSPHAWGVKAKVNVTGHLAAAFPDVVPTIEGVPEDYIKCYDETGYEFKNGILTIPEKPGFGMDLEWSWPVPIYKPY